MNILVIGCGRVGAALAITLDRKGHDVSVIDRNQERFASPPPAFPLIKTYSNGQA